MTNNFEFLEEDFYQQSLEARKKISDLPNHVGEPKKKLVRQIHKDLNDLENTLEQMQKAIRSMDNTERSSASKKLRGYKQEFKEMNQELQRGQEKYPNSKQEREELMDQRHKRDKRNLDQREKLLLAKSKLKNSDNSAKRSLQLSAQTEELGTGILQDLHGQRKNLEGANENVTFLSFFYSK
ncbi:vesicle transport through interaction with t-snares [Anaeramoeba flamelloides]|uniref:Vesicle transport through interaction with t-snares n=1 Tax=Anaeramoeba flamelloides TaxID=1746091 RepID=A0AAV7YUB8_9EUKA|nr:vesicle transport through interaction with t-snares [Anaeramoeba flamelloides]